MFKNEEIGVNKIPTVSNRSSVKLSKLAGMMFNEFILLLESLDSGL